MMDMDPTPQQQHAEGTRELNLLRTFETRLWEVDVQVHGITNVCFGKSGPPCSRDCSQYRALVSRIHQSGLVLAEESQVGLFLPGVTLLVEVVDRDRVNLTIVKIATGRDLREKIFDEPISNEDLNTVILFVLAFHRWCGRSSS